MSTEIEFIGYAMDCRVEGRLVLDDARLADFLNRSDKLTLRNVTVLSHLDGTTSQLDELEVDRDELTAVVASGPRGDPHRRLRTTPREIAVSLGGYVAKGFVHSMPTADALRGFDKRPPMVALTAAHLTYAFCDEQVAEECETLLVNRDLTRSIKPIPAPKPGVPGLHPVPVAAPSTAA